LQEECEDVIEQPDFVSSSSSSLAHLPSSKCSAISSGLHNTIVISSSSLQQDKSSSSPYDIYFLPTMTSPIGIQFCKCATTSGLISLDDFESSSQEESQEQREGRAADEDIDDDFDTTAMNHHLPLNNTNNEKQMGLFVCGTNERVLSNNTITAKAKSFLLQENSRIPATGDRLLSFALRRGGGAGGDSDDDDDKDDEDDDEFNDISVDGLSFEQIADAVIPKKGRVSSLIKLTFAANPLSFIQQQIIDEAATIAAESSSYNINAAPSLLASSSSSSSLLSMFTSSTNTADDDVTANSSLQSDSSSSSQHLSLASIILDATLLSAFPTLKEQVLGTGTSKGSGRGSTDFMRMDDDLELL
jgi:hypothetical protein